MPKVSVPKLDVTMKDTSAYLLWTKPIGADNFQYRYKESGDEWSTPVEEATTSDNLTGLERGKIYLFQVQAHGDGIKRAAEWGAWSAEKEGRTTSHPRPANMTIYGASTNSISIHIPSPSTATAFEIERRKSTETEWEHEVKYPLSGLARAIINRSTRLEHSQTYDFRVRFYGNGKSHSSDAGLWGTIQGRTIKPFIPAPDRPGSCPGDIETNRLSVASTTPHSRFSLDGASHTAQLQIEPRQWRHSSMQKLMCMTALLTNKSKPGAKASDWELRVAETKLHLGADFDTGRLGRDIHNIRDLRAAYKNESTPTVDNTPVDVSHSCLHCEGGTIRSKHLGALHAFFALGKVYAFGLHEFEAPGWRYTYRTSLVWTAPTERVGLSDILHVSAELGWDVGADKAAVILFWMKDKYGGPQ